MRPLATACQHEERVRSASTAAAVASSNGSAGMWVVSASLRRRLLGGRCSIEDIWSYIRAPDVLGAALIISFFALSECELQATFITLASRLASSVRNRR